MRCSRTYRMFVAALGVLSIALGPARALASGTGLKPADARHLHALGYAVVPNPIPAGFRVAKVWYDPGSSGYHVRYVRTSDGATFTISGTRGGGGTGAGRGGADAAATPAPVKHGLFAGLASVFKRREGGTAVASTTTGTAGEAEENGQKGIVMDSRVVGTMALLQQPGGSCYAGRSDTAKGMIHNASFSVQACNLDRPDAVVRAYRSLQRL